MCLVHLLEPFLKEEGKEEASERVTLVDSLVVLRPHNAVADVDKDEGGLSVEEAEQWNQMRKVHLEQPMNGCSRRRLVAVLHVELHHAEVVVLLEEGAGDLHQQIPPSRCSDGKVERPAARREVVLEIGLVISRSGATNPSS